MMEEEGSMGRLAVGEKTGKGEDWRAVLWELESRGAGQCWLLYFECGARPARGLTHHDGRQGGRAETELE